MIHFARPYANLFSIILMLSLVATMAFAQEGRSGGTLTIGYHNSLQTADVMGSTATRDEIWQLVYEPLITMDENLEPAPILAESWEVAEDGLSWTIRLRQGVKFHDGTDMTADDVVASFDRLQRVGARRSEFSRIERIEKIDEHTVVFHTNGPWGALPETFSMPSGSFVVHPASVVEALGDELITVTDFELMIGTGPYRIVELIPGERYRFVRFEDYSQPSGEASGWAGPRANYADEIVVIPITDDATRALALFAGEVDVADQLPPEDLIRLEADPNTIGLIQQPGRRVYLKMNSQEGPFTDPLLREAVRTAINLEDAMFAQGPEGSWRVNPFVRFQEGQWMWDTSVMEDYYPNDLERARELVAASSYNGETIRYLTRQDIPDFFRPTPVILELLQDIGLNAELLVVDGATFAQIRRDMGAWDIKGAGGGSVVPLSYLDASGVDRNNDPWAWVDERWTEQLEIIANDLNDETRRNAVLEINRLSAEAAGEIWLGDLFAVKGHLTDVMNVGSWHYMRAFDIWLDR